MKRPRHAPAESAASSPFSAATRFVRVKSKTSSATGHRAPGANPFADSSASATFPIAKKLFAGLLVTASSDGAAPAAPDRQKAAIMTVVLMVTESI